jgi:hypothetical protein
MNLRPSNRSAAKWNGTLREFTKLAGDRHLDPLAEIVKSAHRITGNSPIFQILETLTVSRSANWFWDRANVWRNRPGSRADCGRQAEPSC